MLLAFPFTLAPELDPGTVDQQVQGTAPGLVGNGDFQGLLPPAECAEVRNRPIQIGSPEKAFDESGGLPQGQSKQTFNGQAELDGGIAEGGIAADLAGQRGSPAQVVIEPDGQGAASAQGSVIGGPVRGLVLRGGRFAHGQILHSQQAAVSFVQQSRTWGQACWWSSMG